jgi:hypothetical protein
MRYLFRLIAITAASAAALGCGAGGTNDVSQVGASHGEEPGGKNVSGKIGSGSSTPSTSVGTIAALCVQACSHLHAADCDQQPAWKAAECESDCSAGTGGSGTTAECDDELVKYLNCQLSTPVECSNYGEPQQEGCEPLNTAYKDCLDHGGSQKYPGCVAVPNQDYYCYQTNFHYYQCTSSASPSPSCQYTGPNAFCCP